MDNRSIVKTKKVNQVSTVRINKLSVVFLLISTILILSSSVKAFDVTTQLVTNTVCPGSTILIEDTVTADNAGSFEITVDGSASGFVTTIPYSFDILAGESKTINSYVTPPSETTPGMYSFNVNIKHDGNIKQIRHDIVVENCNELSVEIEKPQETCSCEAVTLKAKIKNNGIYEQNYELKLLGPAADFSKLEKQKIRLKPGQETEVTIYSNIPCGTIGSTDLTIQVESLETSAVASATTQITSRQCFGYTLQTEKDFYSICDGQSLSIPVTIKNLGSEQNTYEINFKGKFSHITKKQLTIAGNSESEFNIEMTPPYLQAGTYILEIESLSDKGNIIIRKDITVEVRKCHDLTASIEKTDDKMCNALTNTYSIDVVNGGEVNTTVNLEMSGPEWAKLSQTTLTLMPKEHKTVTLEVSPPYGTSSRVYDIKVKAIDKISKAESTTTIGVETQTRDECYMPRISITNSKIEVSKDGTATAMFVIENKGSRKATYLVSMDGTATRFSNIIPTLMTLEPNKADTTYIYIAPSKDIKVGQYSLTLSVRLNDTTILASKTVNVNVKEESIKVEKINLTTNQNQTNQTSVITIFTKIKDSVVNFFKKIGTALTTFRFKHDETEASEIDEIANIIGNNNNTDINITAITGEEETENATKTAENLVTGMAVSNNASENENESGYSELVDILGQNKTQTLNNASDLVKQNKWNILAIVVIIAIIIILTTTGGWKKIVQFFEE